jgi:hypothetical protein
MRNNGKASMSDVAETWCDLTGDTLKEVQHRCTLLVRERAIPNFRLSQTTLTVETLSTFVLAMLSTSQHNMATKAAEEKGALRRNKVVSKATVELWKPDGTLFEDLLFLMKHLRRSSKESTRWAPALLEVSASHNYAQVVVYDTATLQVVHIHYGEPLISKPGSVKRVRRNMCIEASILEPLVKLADFNSSVF